MSSPEQQFQTVVDKTPSQDERENAIDGLVQTEECDKLAILVQMGGLDGPLRRRALNGMADAGCDELLRTLAVNGGLEASLQSDIQTLLEQ